MDLIAEFAEWKENNKCAWKVIASKKKIEHSDRRQLQPKTKKWFQGIERFFFLAFRNANIQNIKFYENIKRHELKIKGK